MTLKAREVTTLDGVRALQPAWQELAKSLAEPNVFYEDWMLVPAWELLRKSEDLRLIAIEEGNTLLGVFPLELKRTFKKLPVPHLRLWQHKHCFLCTPLIRQGRVEEVISSFYGWLGSSRDVPRLMLWNWIAGDGPILPAIRSWAAKHASGESSDAFERCILVPNGDAEAHINAVVSGSHLRDLRRLERRLGEAGEFTYDSIKPGDPASLLDDWIAQFLEIEASGWKGRQKTAMGCCPDDTKFFERCIRGAHERGKLLTLEAKLDGKAIASRCNFRSGDSFFSFKIAFDEKHSKSRPGLLLEVEHMRQAFASGIAKVDYCADPGHPMIDRFSSVRKPIVTMATASRFLLEGLVLKLAPHAERLKERFEKLRHPKLAKPAARGAEAANL